MNYYSYSYNDQLERYQSVAPWKNLDRSITNVVVEDGITSVSGFYNHSELQSVSLPNSLTKIDRATFQTDIKLKDITIPPNVTTIGHGAFHSTSIEYFTIPESYRKTSTDYATGNTHLFGSNALKGITFEGNADFDKDMLLGSNFSLLTSIYCDKSNEKCQAFLNDEEIGSKIKFYEPSGSQYFYNGKFYKNPSDIATGNYIRKRIYTIEEAEKLSKETGNTFKLRYK